MAKILVVDDETDLEVLIKQKFRQKIREHKYEFVFAINGKHALEQLEQNDRCRCSAKRYQYARNGWAYIAFKDQ